MQSFEFALRDRHLFDDLSRQEMADLLHHTHYREFPAGFELLVEGETGRAMYIIVKGALQIDTRDESGREIVLAKLEAGTYAGEQAAMFQTMRQTMEVQFSFAEDLRRHTAMFADFASAAACVNCHNAHEQSPKKDWQLNDLMGATTWTYPKAKVSLQEAMQIIGAVRQAFVDAYNAYLDEASGFASPHAIGAQWPGDGYFLPDNETFFGVFEQLASGPTVQAFLTTLSLKDTPRAATLEH